MRWVFGAMLSVWNQSIQWDSSHKNAELTAYECGLYYPYKNPLKKRIEMIISAKFLDEILLFKIHTIKN